MGRADRGGGGPRRGDLVKPVILDAGVFINASRAVLADQFGVEALTIGTVEALRLGTDAAQRSSTRLPQCCCRVRP